MPKANPLTKGLAKKKAAAAAAASEKKIALVEPKKPKSPSREGRVLVGGHFHPEVQMILKILAAEKHTTVQALLSDALNLLFEKYGKSPIADIT